MSGPGGKVSRRDAEIRKLQLAVVGLDRAKNGAYAERNMCVALLARMALALGLRAGLSTHPAEDASWEQDWRTIVLIDLPTGQVSWHFHDSEKPLLEGLPSYEGTWDGHTTPQKYERVGLAYRATQE